jgi:hypothetical protein
MGQFPVSDPKTELAMKLLPELSCAISPPYIFTPCHDKIYSQNISPLIPVFINQHPEFCS